MTTNNNNFYRIDGYLQHLPHLAEYLSGNIDLLMFTKVFFQLVNRTKFEIADHHREICNKLNEVLRYDHPTNNVIFNIPPRHSKSELAVIMLISYAYALNPNCEFMHFSSSDALVNRNVSNIRKIIDSEAYKMVFPHVELTNNAKGSICTSQDGVLYAAPFLGQITGFGCGKFGSEKFAGAMIIDDPIKTQDALSETIREKVNFTWQNTLISRKNDMRTPVIVICQRTHENDFCGHLIEKEGTLADGGKWDVITMPAIIDDGLPTERALWENRISLDELKRQRSELGNWSFQTQYMQQPYAIEGLMFPHNETKYYEEEPADPDYTHIQVDVADEGSDYFCACVYKIFENKVLVVDCIYTKENTDVTTYRLLELIKRHAPATCNIESNSAFMIFTRSIREKAGEEGLATLIRAIQNHTNKEVRVLSQSEYIKRNFYYSKTDNAEYKLMLKHRHSYLKMIKNQRDDSVDADTSASEYLRLRGIVPNI